MLDLRDAQELLDWMRAYGVIHARVGDVELSLAETPSVEASADGDFDIATIDTSYDSPYDDPLLYPDGELPQFDGHAPKTPKTGSEDRDMTA
jgi:hypothetical protein